MLTKKFLITWVSALALAASTSAYAQNPGGLVEPGDPTSAKPGILSKIAIDQRIGHQVPLDIPFVDENGRQVTLGDYFGKRPVVLALVYYECPMLCTQVLNGLVSALGVLNFEAGREFDVVAVSFNPKEGPGLASQKKASYVERYGRPQAAGGWHFLTGIAGIDHAADRRRRLQVRVRPEDRAVRPWRGDRGPDAEGHDREVLLRHRVLAAGPPARAHRGVGRTHRDGRRRRAALLLPLRPVERQVRCDRPRDRSCRRRRHRAGVRRIPDGQPAPGSRARRAGQPRPGAPSPGHRT